jgi:hypothetical protein
MSVKKASSSLASKSRVGFTPTGGGAAVTISNVIVTDSSWNNLDDTAVGTSSSYIKIIGSGFVVNPSVYIGTTQVSSGSITFVSSTELRVVLPSLSLGTQNLFVFNTDYSGAIWSAGLVVSGFPDYTQTVYTSLTPLSVSVQLLATGDAPLTYALQGGSSLPAGTSLSSSGLITGTTTDGTYQFTVIVSDAQNQSFQQQLTLTITSTDQYFNITPLAINADTDTFVRDASSNNFPITINGDTRPSAFSPYNTNWSNYFGGGSTTERRLTTTQTAIGTGNFTVAFWVYLVGTTGNDQQFFDTGTGGFVISVNTSTQLQLNNRAAGTTTISPSSATAIPLNTWVHVAVVRSGTGASQVTMYVNGSSVGTGTMSSNFTSTTISIGGRYEVDAGTWYTTFGYISNVLYADSALSITVPTTPYTNQSGTKLLTCQSNRLIDNSTNNFTITKNGDTKVSAFGPFTETDTTTGSAYFDGTGDYLTVPDSASFDLPGDFTVEFFAYATGSNVRRWFQLGDYRAGQNGLLIYSASFSSIVVYVNDTVIITGPTLVPYQWVHIACVREGAGSNNLKLYVNGSLAGQVTNTLSFVGVTGNGISLGAEYGGSFSATLETYMSDFRLVKGTAVYTAAFTPPTAPLTAVANTQILTLQTRQPVNNHTFIDVSGNNNLITRNGNPTQGSFSPYSPAGWSNYFDGSGDFLTLSGTSATNFNGVDWTFECWFYKTALSGGNDSIIQSTAGTNNWIPYFGLGLNNNFTIAASINAAAYNSSQTYSLNAWNHIAMVRSGGVVKVYLNGTATSISVTSDITSTNLSFWFGKTDNAPGGGNYLYYFNGYLSNLRLVKGTAVYTSNFTPSTTPLTAIANTSLLTCQSNRFIDNSTNNFAITKNGDTKVVNFSPFAPTAAYSPITHGGSAYFDGTGDYISIPSSVTTYTSGGSTTTNKDFTIEGFFYLNVLADGILFARWPSYNTRGLSCSVGSTGTINFQCANVAASWLVSIASSAGVVKTGEWNHFAVTRAGTTYRLFLNGALIGSSSPTAFVISDETTNITIGGSLVSGYTIPFNGYISNVRFNTTQALYTTAFTPPTSILPNSLNTVLSLPFNNAAIVDASSRNFMETIGGARLISSTRKYGTGSMYFDGTDDRLTFPASPFFAFPGDFTIEFWSYNQDVSGSTQRGYLQISDTAGGLKTTYTSGIIIAQSISGGGNLGVNIMGTALNSSAGVIIANQWQHIAVTRASGVVKLFVDGTQVATSTISTSITGQNLVIGGYYNTSYLYNGYIDDLRITRFARYTANFTPPTSTFLTQ